MPYPGHKVAGATRLDGRYRVDGEIGRGGMARVYRVVDERSDQALALKHLVAPGERGPAMRAMFEREYHTLVQLAHPRIIRVFDYGVTAEGPYYTMELLEGSDARTLVRTQALDVRALCLLLRDVAAALALIHSRRLVHRDVSPRNVWCTPERRAKLIDFGTLVAMGPQTRCAGTPPFVPPEALYQQPLDARCDLFALGALAYYMLTRRYAYPARDVAELPEYWQRRPKRPDQIRPELPRALADLVMALLSLDARGRPASAAEVCERLTAIGGLPAEDERHLAQAFLTSPTLVGRGAATAELRARLLRARRGRGAALAIVAKAGLGRSRMLASFVLDAKLMGATAISLDASAVGSEPFALGAALAERLLETVPLAMAAVIELQPVLSNLSSEVHRAFGAPQRAELKPFERASKLRSALLALISAASRRAQLVIAVDDVHRGDSASLDVLARLSLVADEQRVLLVTSCDEDALVRPSPALEQLTSASRRISLPPLDTGDTRELLSSLFGAAAGLDDAASWLHELSQGSPQTCMQYAQYLVDQGIARYEKGRWTLPSDLRERALPATLDAMLERRLAELSGDARALLLGLSLARDETRAYWQPELHVRIEDYPALLGIGGSARATQDVARTFEALDELLRAGMLQQRDNRYVIAQRATAEVLLRTSSEEERRRMHERLAAVFDNGAYLGSTLAIRQLQRAGRHERARARILRFANHLASGTADTVDWRGMRVSVSAECALVALEHFQAHGGPPREGVLLRRMLLLTCSVYDWGMSRLGEPQIAQLRADCGLTHWDATDPQQRPLERALECMRRAQEQYDRTPEGERGLAPEEALRELAACALPLQGAFVNTHDADSARRLLAGLDPLRVLSPLVALGAELCELGIDRITGREEGDRLLAVGVQKMMDASGLPDVVRQGGAGIHLYLQAVHDARKGRGRALQLLELLAARAGDDMFMVLHGRFLAYAFGGRAGRAARYRKQAELITEDDVWRRKALLFVEAELFALTGELLDLSRTCDAIAELAQQFEGWQPWLAWARAELYRLRGEIDGAELEVNAALALAKPGEHRAYLRAAALAAELKLARGDPERAIRIASALRAAASQRGLDRTAIVTAERLYALGESARGQHDAAALAIERALSLARELQYGGLPLAVVYETATRIAIAAGNVQGCSEALCALHGLLEHANAPALIRAYEALREDSRQLAIEELPSVASVARSEIPSSSQAITEVRVRLGAADQRTDRAAQALDLIVDDTGAADGHLFLLDAGGLFAAASTLNAPDEGLLARAQRYLELELGATEYDAPSLADFGSAASTPAPPTRAGGSSRPPRAALDAMLLAHPEGDALAITGVVLLGGRAAPPRQPRPELLRAISLCLSQTGDSQPRSV